MDRSKKEEGKSIYRIPPYYYIHVLDQNSNVTKLVVGPHTFIRQDNEKVYMKKRDRDTVEHVAGERERERGKESAGVYMPSVMLASFVVIIVLKIYTRALY